ncbi:excalibur calcium-binding domain-containing protein [Faucicola atlantae]|uniref:Excalibur calcium-binding domain-containing protein n=1 Tax=Faucicola atlantae TaxID=34059 RepID=A0A1B8QCV6_9GAMM|nr:excalibur calcium-binding domain-containing protein [Moraxella atlantae]OBX79144.1 hypothetical protein A9306_09030 [Moraxella atlantae]
MKHIIIAVIASTICLAPTANAKGRVSCKSFKTQAQAQAYYVKNKAKSLDRDGDGRACDCLPGGTGKNCPTEKK